MAPRNGLLSRLIVGAMLVAIASTAATTWLVARSTTVAIEREQGEALSGDTRIYKALLTYSATHADWSEVGPLVAELAEETGRQVSLTTPELRRIAGHEGRLPESASAVVDARAVDPTIVADNPPGGIAAEAVGPFQLTPQEIGDLMAAARRLVACSGSQPGSVTIVSTSSGRPVVEGIDQDLAGKCLQALRTGPGGAGQTKILTDLTATETRAYGDLTRRTNRCLAAMNQGPVDIGLGFSVSAGASTTQLSDVSPCLDEARREQLAPYVTPPALLYLNSPGRATAEFDLSKDFRRVAGVGIAVLIATIAIAAAGAYQLVRPVRSLTEAARRMTDGDETARVPASGRRDEIGELAVAFNEMADARAHVESLRRAMVGDIAHELRTPLSNIRGWLEAAEDGLEQPDARFIASLSEEAALLQSIIDDLRDLADADAGGLRIHPEHVHLATLIDQSLDAFRLQAEASDIRLTTVADEGAELHADPLRLRQAVGNLVGNALRHTDRGGSVTVHGQVDGDSVLITVEDDGSGIRAADLPNVFDRFWRADPSRSRHHGGSGLGLAIVRSLVEAHGGTASVTSDEGNGAAFTLKLPRRPPT